MWVDGLLGCVFVEGRPQASNGRWLAVQCFRCSRWGVGVECGEGGGGDVQFCEREWNASPVAHHRSNLLPWRLLSFSSLRTA